MLWINPVVSRPWLPDQDQEEEAAAKPAPLAKATQAGEGALGAVKNLRSEDNKYQERDEQRWDFSFLP